MSSSSAFVTKAMGAGTGALPSNPIAAVFEDVQGRAMQIAMENVELVFTFAGKICKAQTFQEIMTLQTQFAQDRMFWCFSLFRARPSKPTLSNAIRSFPRAFRYSPSPAQTDYLRGSPEYGHAGPNSAIPIREGRDLP